MQWSPSFLLAAMLLAGCASGGDPDSEGRQVGPVLYGVGYTVGADKYDDADAEARYLRCADLPGARVDGQADSLPPGRVLRFQGTEAEQEAVVECLNSLPDTKVNGPFQPPAQ